MSLSKKIIKELKEEAYQMGALCLNPKNEYQHYVIGELIRVHELYKYLQLKKYHSIFKMELLKYYQSFKIYIDEL